MPGYELEEFGVGIVLMRLMDILHFRTVGSLHRHLPVGQPTVDIHPSGVIGIAVQRHEELTELLLIVGGGLFRHQPAVVDDLLETGQDLVRVHRFDQIVADLCADGLVHQVLRLILGDHDDRDMRVLLLDAGEGLQPRHAGHRLVQQNHIDRLRAQEFQGIGTVREHGDCIALRFQETLLGFQAFDLVIYPKDLRQ